MLSEAQVETFFTQGYLVIEDVLPAPTIDAVRAEYAGVMDALYAGWVAQGRVPGGAHASLPNRSDHFRWSFDLRYNVSGQNTGRSHFPDFIARSRSAPSTELRDWRIWRDQWTDARARRATSPHIPIHRWDSTAPFCA